MAAQINRFQKVDIVVDGQWNDNREVMSHSAAIMSTPQLGSTRSPQIREGR